MKHLLALTLWIALPASAQALVCVADTQCRGDAQKMCAESTLRIEVTRRGGSADLWIDYQGPYTARITRDGDATHLSLPLFQGHELRLNPDGTFIYRGNRGKRFTGTCEGEF